MIVNNGKVIAIDKVMVDYSSISGDGQFVPIGVKREFVEGVVNEMDIGDSYDLPIASDTVLGGVRIGENLSIDDSGVLSADATVYSAGDGIVINDSYISVDNSYIGDVVRNNFVTYLENYVTSEENDVVQEKLIAGEGISINGVVISSNVEFDEYELPIASDTVLGGVQIGENLSIDDSGVLSADATVYKAGDGISIDDGVISSNVVNEYELPIASDIDLGGVKIGDGVDIDDGVISINDSYVGDIVENNFVTNLENYVTSEENDVVQEKLKEGANISIVGNVISADDTIYTLPTASDNVLGGVKVGSGLSIDGSGVLRTIYSAGDGIDIDDGVINIDKGVIQEKLTAGENISIDGNVISADDTKYTAGTNISIDKTNKIISAVDTKYTLPTATESTLGGVKIGEGIIVDEHGEISVEADMGFIKAKRTDFTITKTNENLLTGLTVSSVQNRFLIQDGYLYVRSHTPNDNNGVGVFSLSVSVNLSQDTREGFNYLNKIELVGGEVVDELILSSENYFNSVVGKNQLDVTTTVRKLTSNNSVEVNGFMFHKYELLWKGDYIQDSNQKVNLTISCVEEAKGVLGSALEVSEEFNQFIDTLNSRIISNMDFGAIDDIYQHSNGGGSNSRGIGTLFTPSMNMPLGTNTQISVVAGQTSGSNIIFAIYEVEVLANNSATKLHWVANTNRVNSLGNSWNRFYLTELKENAMLKSDKLYYTMVFTENLNDLHIAGNKIINTGSKMTNSSMNPKFIISVPFDESTTSENLKNVYGTIESGSIEGYLNRIFMSLTNV